MLKARSKMPIFLNEIPPTTIIIRLMPTSRRKLVKPLLKVKRLKTPTTATQPHMPMLLTPFCFWVRDKMSEREVTTASLANSDG